jgi:hypothetical protein
MQALRVTIAEPGQQALRVQIVGNSNDGQPFNTQLTILTTANSDHTSNVGDNTFLDAIKLHYDGSFYAFQDDDFLPYNFECIALFQGSIFLGVAAPYIRVGPANDPADSTKACQFPLPFPLDVKIKNVSNFQNADNFYPCFATSNITWGNIRTLIKPI